MDVAVVYLYRPFVHGTEVELTMNDNVHCVAGNQFVAAAAVRGILYKDIVLSNGGIIVPVIVVPFLHSCKPFGFESLNQFAKDWSNSELQDETDTSPMVIDEFGICAQSMSDQTGYHLLSYIDEDYALTTEQPAQ